MILQWQNQQNKYKSLPIRKLVGLSIEAVLSIEPIGAFLKSRKIEPVFSVILVDNQAIKAINRQFRQIDQATDVLSFPLMDTDGKILTKIDLRQIPLNGKGKREVCFGDIVISAQKAQEQSIAYGHSFAREIAFLTVHSVLHLLGYDHLDTIAEKKMIRRQKQIMETIPYDL